MVVLRKIILLLFFSGVVLLSPQLFAQEVSDANKELAKQLVESADEILAVTSALDLAREQYMLAADADPTNVQANYKAGDAIIKTVGKERAAKYFEQVYAADPDFRFDILYKIGRSYQYDMSFDQALDYYNRYRDKLLAEDGYRGRDKVQLSVVDRNIYESRNGKELVANPAHYSIVNVGSAINTENREYGPVLNEEETELVFTSRRQDGNLNENVADDNVYYEDIFISKKVNGVWQPAQNMGETINTQFHDSNLAMSADGMQLFLYSDENNGDIYTSKKLGDGTWTTPEAMGPNINSSFKESSVSLSPDGNMLFFASNRPSHVGDNENLDIYYSVKDKNDVWGRPKTLGEVINSEFNEDAPFFDYDGKTLYFSSDGRKGMGGYDIFRSVYDSTHAVWGEPQNIGYPVNTPDNDVFFVSTKDGKRGYYASVREDGMGYTDIYMVTVLQDDDIQNQLASKNIESKDAEAPDASTEVAQVDVGSTASDMTLQPVILTVNVEDFATELPIDAKVGLKGVGDNVIVPSRRQTTGIYTFEVKNIGSKEYMLSVEKNGYIFKNTKLSIEAVAGLEPKKMTRNVSLQKVQTGVSRILHNIYFDFAKATFTTDSYAELNKLEKMLASNSNTQVEIAGHTDAIGHAAGNKRLSQRRADAVVSYLVNKGIDQRRLTSVGYGEEKPLASNDDEFEGRSLNRRVEFRILGNK
jgi:outer membrane protein OmpA-like peptidoglycan-associated protein/tetratricopeptide (TPR) repeat protein